jgi:hypothetical protein
MFVAGDVRHGSIKRNIGAPTLVDSPLGHKVSVANPRGPETLTAFAAETGAR